MYDPRLGRWFAVDPLASKYPSLSPYNFVGNSPIKFIDPDGKDIHVTRIANGGENGKDLIVIKITGKFIDKTSKNWHVEALTKRLAKVDPSSKRYNTINQKLNVAKTEYNSFVTGEIDKLKKSLTEVFTGKGTNVDWEMEADITLGALKSSDHAFYLVDDVMTSMKGHSDPSGRAAIGGLYVYYDIEEKYVRSHEAGHSIGLVHAWDNLFNGKKAKSYNGIYKTNEDLLKDFNIPLDNIMNYDRGTSILEQQILKIEQLYNDGLLNQGSNKYTNDHGEQQRPNFSIEPYRDNYKK